jgi:hypothetical protein
MSEPNQITFEAGNDGLAFIPPDKENSVFLDLKTHVSHNMLGQAKTRTKGPPVLRFRLAFTILSGLRASDSTRVAPSKFIGDLQTFIFAHLADVVKYTDWTGTVYNVKFVKPNYDYINSIREASTFVLEMEKV